MSSASKTQSERRNPLLRAGLVALAVIVLLSAGYWIYHRLDAKVVDYDVEIIPDELPADGVSSAQLEIRLISRFGNRLNASVLPKDPEVTLAQGKDLVKAIKLSPLRYRLIAGFETGEVVVRVKIPGAIAPLESRLYLMPSLADRNRNGYPDALDLTSASDRENFRRWFTAIAEGQLTHIDDRWHDRDCAGLLRYCYREALKRHDNKWLAERQWLESPAIPDVQKYNYPSAPLVGTRVFNAGSRPSDEESSQHVDGDQPGRMQRAAQRSSTPLLENFHDFAEASRLKDNSLQYLSRELQDALPGDVIFYLNDTDAEWPYHSMIYLGNGRTVYHTGPDGDDPGIVKSLTLKQLAAHPNPRWHPTASNPYFLGFYRWRVLG